MTRLLGVDHGTRRIGLAIGETETGMAFARPVLRVRRQADAVDAVVALAVDEQVARVVVGLPRNMDGSEGEQAAAARAFGAELAARGLDVVYRDERLTSWEAGERIGAAGGRPSRRGGELDSAAACLILQEYLVAPDPH